MIAVWESDISDTFVIPRLNCPIEQTIFNAFYYSIIWFYQLG